MRRIRSPIGKPRRIAIGNSHNLRAVLFAALPWRVCRRPASVVVLSQFADDDYAFELLENGVGGLGYLLKERVADKDELVRALQEVARGGSALDPKVIEVLLARKSHEEPSALLGLSDREREVLQQMATGRNNHTIAKTLYMSDRAVEKHIGSIFQKLGLVEEVDVNRRIMAVLAFLDATGSTR